MLLHELQRKLSQCRQTESGWSNYKLCPFCKSAKFKFGVHVQQSRFYCFKCGASGSLEHLCQELGVPFKETRKAKPLTNAALTANQSVIDLAALKWKRLPVLNPSDTEQAISAYLANRNVDLQLWEVGVSCTPRLYGRAVWLFRTCGVPVYYQARAVVGPQEPKTLNPPPGVGCKRDQANLSHDVYKTGYEIVLCEGPFDAVSVTNTAAKRVGVPLLGKTLSEAKLNALSDMGVRKVAVFLDSDASDYQAKACIAAYDYGFEVSYVDWLDRKGDPSSIGAEASQTMLNNATLVTPATRLRLLSCASRLERQRRLSAPY